MVQVGLCTPHGHLVSPKYYRSVLTMQGQFHNHTFVHVEVDTQIVAKARNMLIEAARAAKCEVLWFVDNDTLVPPDAGVLIDQAMQLGVVSGVYFNRRPPYHPQIYEAATEEQFDGMYWPLLEYPKEGIRKEAAIGAGCMAVRADLFLKLEEAWKPKVEAASALLSEYPSLARIVRDLSPWFEFLDKKGEDLYFSERLTEAGVPIFVNYNIKCSHLTDVEIIEQYFTQLRDAGLIHKGEPGMEVLDEVANPTPNER